MKKIILRIDETQASHLMLGLEYYLEYLKETQKDLNGLDIEDVETFEVLIAELRKHGIVSE